MGALLSLLFVPYQPPVKPGSSVLITGCDTGFGHMLAVQLVARGYRVFAGCLTPEGVEALRAETQNSDKLTAFKLDVTKQEDIAACADRIRAACPDGLDALVNNAGVAVGYLIEWSTSADFRRNMDVNYHGMVDMILAHLPLLRKAKHPRIINVSSAAGFTTAISMGGYTASKHAVEGFSDVLRLELAPFGIAVSIIEPAFQRTNIIKNLDDLINRAYEAASPEVQELYGPEFLKGCHETAKRIERIAVDPQWTVDAMIAALTDTHPRHRYRVGYDANTIFLLLSKLPTFWTDKAYRLIQRNVPLPAGAKRLKSA